MGNQLNSEEIIIELSPIKVFFIFIGSAVFVGIGFWFLSVENIEAEIKNFIVFGIGVLSVIFFGATGLFALYKFFDRKPGLILSEKGLFDNSSAVSAGWINWDQIKGFRCIEIQKQKLLIIEVKNAKGYLLTSNKLKRMLVNANLKMFGSPIIISSNALKFDFESLVELCNKFFEKYSNNA